MIHYLNNRPRLCMAIMVCIWAAFTLAEMELPR